MGRTPLYILHTLRTEIKERELHGSRIYVIDYSSILRYDTMQIDIGTSVSEEVSAAIFRVSKKISGLP